MNRSRLYLFILIAFIVVAVAFFLYRWSTFLDERQKIYGAVHKEIQPLNSLELTQS